MSKYSRVEIINKGIELMRQHGYHGTGVQHILHACGIPKGSFYNFFESKQDFTLQAIEKYGLDNLKAVEDLKANANLTAVDKVARFFSDLERFYRSKNYELTCLMSLLSLELAGEDELIAEKIEAKFNDIKKVLTQIIKEGQSSGEIRRDFRAARISDFLITSFNGALITMKYERTSRAIKEFQKMCLPFLAIDI